MSRTVIVVLRQEPDPHRQAGSSREDFQTRARKVPRWSAAPVCATKIRSSSPTSYAFACSVSAWTTNGGSGTDRPSASGTAEDHVPGHFLSDADDPYDAAGQVDGIPPQAGPLAQRKPPAARATSARQRCGTAGGACSGGYELGSNSVSAMRLQNIVFDCRDAYELGSFWSAVVGRPLGEGDKPGDEEVIVEMPEGPTLFFAQVPEPKTVKNRLHVCLQPDELRDAEVERVLSLGATMVDDRRRPDGTGWAVLADLEGNEFCMLRSAAERH